jgi:hypothetical protein
MQGSGLGPESIVVQGCHAPHAVHGRVRLPAGRQGFRIADLRNE